MERRPLAVRGTKLANSAAKFCAKIDLSPNKISVLSVGFALASTIFFYLAIKDSYFLILAALSIQLRLICNLLDGMVAIEYNKKSVYGNLYNDIPDRFADALIIMGAGLYAGLGESLQHWAIHLAWLNSLFAILTAYIRVLGTSLNTPTNFSGLMAKPQRMAILTFASVLAFFVGSQYPVVLMSLVLMIAGQVITVITRIHFIARELKKHNLEE